MQDAFGIVIFAVVGISAVLAIASLFLRGNVYDEIGRGGIGDDREMGRAGGGPPSGGYVDTAERDAEIRQMLAARNARAAARGEPEVDVENELARLTAPAVDPALREEVREMVVARNRRREARGQEPLDVEAEVDRQLREFGG
jgi:hypothetical protein